MNQKRLQESELLYNILEMRRQHLYDDTVIWLKTRGRKNSAFYYTVVVIPRLPGDYWSRRLHCYPPWLHLPENTCISY